MEFLPANQLSNLPLANFFPLLSVRGSEPLGEICPVAVSCETGQSPSLLTFLLYKLIWGLSFFPVQVSLGVVRWLILVSCTLPFPSARAMCCQKQPEFSSDSSLKHSLPSMSWLYFNKIIRAGQLLRKYLPVCVMLHYCSIALRKNSL